MANKNKQPQKPLIQGKASRPPEQDERQAYYWDQDRVRRFGQKYPTFRWPSVELILNLIYTYDAVVGHLAQQLAPHGLSRASFNVLMILSRSEGKACKQRDISRLMLVSRANITGLVDGLVRQDLVARSTPEHDRRVCMVQISPKGERLLEGLLPDYYRRVDRLCSVLAAADKKKMNELFSGLRAGVSDADQKNI